MQQIFWFATSQYFFSLPCSRLTTQLLSQQLIMLMGLPLFMDCKYLPPSQINICSNCWLPLFMNKLASSLESSCNAPNWDICNWATLTKSKTSVNYQYSGCPSLEIFLGYLGLWEVSQLLVSTFTIFLYIPKCHKWAL